MRFTPSWYSVTVSSPSTDFLLRILTTVIDGDGHLQHTFVFAPMAINTYSLSRYRSSFPDPRYRNSYCVLGNDDSKVI